VNLLFLSFHFAASFFAIEQFADEDNHLQEGQYNHLFFCPLTWR